MTQAHYFLRAMYELMAAGNDEQKAQLLNDLMKWEAPLSRVISEAYNEGRKAKDADVEMLRSIEGVIQRMNKEENGY